MNAFDSLDAYVGWFDGVPLPIHEQRERFVDYVSHVVSWYKRSPLPSPFAQQSGPVGADFDGDGRDEVAPA